MPVSTSTSCSGRQAAQLRWRTNDDALLELHVRHIPGGLFTEQVFTQMKEKDILRFNGPHGTFFLREESTKPMVMIAGGTGFAPIRSVVEHAIAEGCTRPITVKLGRTLPVPTSISATSPKPGTPGTLASGSFPYYPRRPPATAGKGASAWCIEAVMADFPDPRHQVYACGSPATITAAKRDLCSGCKLPESEFFADSFDFANDKT